MRAARPRDAYPGAPEGPVIDPESVDLQEGTYRFRHDPLPVSHRSLLHERDHINGNPLDWSLQLDPGLDATLVAVRDPYDGRVHWFDKANRLRSETFTSPLAQRDWRPDQRLVRSLLAHVPYVLVLDHDGELRHTFDLRSVEDPRPLARLVRTQPGALPATGGFAASEGMIPCMQVHVPYAGQRFARSTRKRFRLRVPGGPGDATVEATAARILTAHGHSVESPRTLVALYRLMVGEVVAYWWKDPARMERSGSLAHHPPGANPLEATLRGLAAVRLVAEGDAAQDVKRLGETVIQKGHRPPTYRRFVNRLARLADACGPAGLAGVLEGILRGHGAHSADLVATHPGLRRPMLVEVKSRGDRIRPSQVEAALYHERDQRAMYRIMRIDHPMDRGKK